MTSHQQGPRGEGGAGEGVKREGVSGEGVRREGEEKIDLTLLTIPSILDNQNVSPVVALETSSTVSIDHTTQA